MDQDFEYHVGQKIRYFRTLRGLTQEQLAARLQTNGCDVTRSALAKIEVGQRHVYADELYCLATVLHVTVDELLQKTASLNQQDTEDSHV